MVDKSSVHVFKTVMKHPKLSKVMGDAFSAPIGSTKRSQALAMLNSIYKISDKKFQNDGQGGGESQPYAGNGGNDRLRKYLPYIMNKEETSNDFMVLNAAPKMGGLENGRGGNYNNSSPSLSGSQPPLWGPGSYAKNINLSINPQTGQLYDPSDIFQGYSPSEGDIKGQQPQKQYGGLQIGRHSSDERITPKTTYPGITSQIPKWGPKKKDIKIELPKQTRKVKTGIVIDGVEHTVDVPIEEEKKQVAAPTIKKPLWGPELDGYKVKGAEKKPVAYGPPKPSDIETTTVAQERANTLYEQYVNAGFSPEEAKNIIKSRVGVSPQVAEEEETPAKYSRLEEMAKKAVGPETFYGDVSLLPITERRKLYPGVPDELLPATTYEIKNILEKETGLKELEDRERELAFKQKHLIPDLTEYIRNRDEYIEGIDKATSNTLYQLSNLRTGSPKEEQDLRNNLNYLKILKGRQNTRYVDFINTSIESFNKEAERVDMEYQKAKDEYSQRFAMSQEAQQIYRSRLSEQWQSLKNMNDPNAFYDLLNKKLDVSKKYEDMIKDSIDSYNQSGINKNTFKEMKENGDRFNDSKTGALLPGIDISSEVSNLLDAGRNPAGVFLSLRDGLDRMIWNMKDDFPSLYREMRGLNNQFFNFVNNATINSKLGEGEGLKMAKEFTQRLADKTKESFIGYLNDKKSIVKDAILDLTPGGWLHTIPTKDEWINKFTNQGLERGLLEDIYAYYERAKNTTFPNDPQNSRAVFAGMKNGKPVKNIDDSNISHVLNEIYKRIMNMVYLDKYGMSITE